MLRRPGELLCLASRMRIIHYIMAVLFLAILIAALVSVRRHGALTLGVSGLIVPVVFRVLISIGAKNQRITESTIYLFDILLIILWSILLLLIALVGTSQNNAHVGWPD